MKPADDPPADELDDRRDAHGALSVHLVAGTDAVKEHIARELVAAAGRNAGRSAKRMPITDLGFEDKTIRQPVIEQKLGLETRMIGPEPVRSLPGWEEHLELQGDGLPGVRNRRQFDTRAHVADAGVIRKSGPWVEEGLGLNPTGRELCKCRKMAGDSVLTLHVQLLKVQIADDVRPRTGSGRIVRGVALREILIAAAFGIEELGAVGRAVVQARFEPDSNLRSDDRVVDISHHAATAARQGGVG